MGEPATVIHGLLPIGATTRAARERCVRCPVRNRAHWRIGPLSRAGTAGLEAGSDPIRAYPRILDEPYRQPGALPQKLMREGTTFAQAELPR